MVTHMQISALLKTVQELYHGLPLPGHVQAADTASPKGLIMEQPGYNESGQIHQGTTEVMHSLIIAIEL